MVKVVGISGSLRKGSYNSALLRAAAGLVQGEASIEVASIRDIPLYDGDVEATSGAPQAARDLKERIASSDGLLLVTPEYNNSIPGVLKNAIDWLTRPADDIKRVFGGLPVGVIGATPGQGGTILSQAAWLPVLRTLGTLPWFGGRLGVSGAGKVFDAEGRIQDATVQNLLEKYVRGFLAFVQAHSRQRARG